MTLDYKEDLLFFRNVVDHFSISCEEMSFENILHYLNSNPDVVQINWFREEEWKNNQIKMINRVIL
jgi:spore coat polysaccharide biosynthesis protein SpsF (cytidylyltransferase family)